MRTLMSLNRLTVAAVAAAVGVVLVAEFVSLPHASAAVTDVALGDAARFAILAGTEVTNTGSSVINGDVGVSTGTSITGFPPGVVKGTLHANDGPAVDAQAALTIAYNDAAGRTPPTETLAVLDGRTLVAGIYKSGSSLGLTGTLALDGQNDPTSVFIFQSVSSLLVASNSAIRLINGAQACHVYFQVGSSATLGTFSTFVGNILASESITAKTGATVDGRLLAKNATVTLDTNTVTPSACATPTASPTATPSVTSEPVPTVTPRETTGPAPGDGVTLEPVPTVTPRETTGPAPGDGGGGDGGGDGAGGDGAGGDGGGDAPGYPGTGL